MKSQGKQGPEKWRGTLKMWAGSWLFLEWNEESQQWLRQGDMTWFSLGKDLSSHCVQFSWSVVSDSLQPHEPRTPGLPVHHQLLESTQIHVHWFSDAIQPSHPLSSPSSPALNLSQHQGLFQWVSSLHQVAEVLELQLQHQSFQWIFRIDFF